MPLVFSAPHSNAPPAQTPPRVSDHVLHPCTQQQQQVTQRAPPVIPQGTTAGAAETGSASSSSSFLSGNWYPSCHRTRSDVLHVLALEPAAGSATGLRGGHETMPFQRSAMKQPAVQRRARPYPEPNVVLGAPQEPLSTMSDFFLYICRHKYGKLMHRIRVHGASPLHTYAQ